jgi:hypothetical protein
MHLQFLFLFVEYVLQSNVGSATQFSNKNWDPYQRLHEPTSRP